MLYDPTRDIPLMLTVDKFKGWVDKQPPEQRYDYYSTCNCALAQYLRANIGEGILVHSRSITTGFGSMYELPEIMNDLVFDGTHTFGALSERAEAYLAA